MILIDTNILVYSRNIKAKQHESSLKVLQQHEQGIIDGVVAIQNVIELHAVLNNLQKLGKILGKQSASTYAENLVEIFEEIIYPTTSSLDAYSSLIRKYGKDDLRVFDTFLVATMLSNGIKQICTCNRKDFEMFDEIEVVEPKELIK